MRIRGVIAFASALTLVIASNAVAQSPDPNPTLWASIAEPAGTVEGPKTPLWNRVKSALEQLKRGTTKAYVGLFRPGASTTIGSLNEQKPFTVEIAKAVTESCLGPFFNDEGKTWIQFSWVCYTTNDTPLSRFYTFRTTSELAVTVWFKGSQIDLLDASEPGYIPSKKRMTLDAAQQMQPR